MTFYIKHSDGTSFVQIADGTIDNSTSLTLVGKNYPLYGEIFNQNFAILLENSAFINAPANPTPGQLWYDTSNMVIKLCRDDGLNPVYWQPLSCLVQSTSAPTTVLNGDMWWDTTNLQLKVYYNSKWTTIGPQTTNPGLISVTGSNSLTVQIGGLNVWSVDKQGRMNMPYNPIVQVNGRLNGVPDTTYYAGAGLTEFQNYLPVPGGVSINVGLLPDLVTPVYIIDPEDFGNFGRFTCPVDGIYQVSGHMQTLGGASAGGNTHIIRFTVNESATDLIAQNSHLSTNNETHTLALSGMLMCTAFDVIKFEYAASSGAKISDSNGGFSIRLVA